jgi:hypothetical protein
VFAKQSFFCFHAWYTSSRFCFPTLLHTLKKSPFTYTHLPVIKYGYLNILPLSGRAVYGMNHLRLLKHWDRGFKSHSRQECLCVFILCLCCHVYIAALRRADPPSKESYPLCTGLINWKNSRGLKGCRAIERKKSKYLKEEITIKQTIWYDKGTTWISIPQYSNAVILTNKTVYCLSKTFAKVCHTSSRLKKGKESWLCSMKSLES